MNRRELFKGFAATLAVVNIPFPVEQLIALPNSEAVAYLKRVRAELLTRIAYPPLIQNRDGSIRGMPDLIQSWNTCLEHIDVLLKELA